MFKSSIFDKTLGKLEILPDHQKFLKNSEVVNF